MSIPVVEIHGLDFAYGEGTPLALHHLHLTVAAGSRLLVVGENGAGKSTLLRVLAGRYQVPAGAVKILGRPVFHDPALASAVTTLDGRLALPPERSVHEIIAALPAHDQARLDHLLDLLRVDRDWRIAQASAPQLHRVQIALQLLVPRPLVLLDEITAGIDFVARANLLRFLHRESTTHGTTVIYASHIVDGLDDWATHLAVLDGGRLRLHARIDDLRERADPRDAGQGSLLYRIVDRVLRE